MSTTFVAEEVNALVKEVVDPLLGGVSYSATKAGEWSSAVIEGVLKRLASLNRSFKYAVTAVIMQKTGAGFHSAAAAVWDATSDGLTTVRWENRSLYCIVTVVGVSL